MTNLISSEYDVNRGVEPRPLTIALAVTQRGWGGGEAQAGLLAWGLRRRGHTCHILARRGGIFAERMASEGFLVTSFAGRCRSPRSIWKMHRHLRQLRPDVLHMNDSHAVTGVGLASLGTRGMVRVAARRVSFPIRSAATYRNLCDQMICVSHDVASVCQHHGIARSQLSVICDGVAPKRADAGSRQRGRDSLQLGDDRLLILNVAKLTDCKGHRYLLDAAAKVIRAFPNAHLAIAGDGELEQELRQQSLRLGIEQHVSFLGFRHDIPDLLKAADVFVVSSHTEGLCSSIIDAMFAGCPIVSTTGGGIPDLVTSDVEDGGPVAWTVEPRDSDSLAETITTALEAPHERAIRAERALHRAGRKFTDDHMVESTLQVYRWLIDKLPQRFRRNAA